MSVKDTAKHRRLLNKIQRCELCPRLVDYRGRVARERKRAYRDCEYWGKPVPSLGAIDARLLLIGLAPGAHGANRTGRMFTGDRSGDFLYPTLHRHGFCSDPASRDLSDGLELRDTYITAALHCVPPSNKPLREELNQCGNFLLEELRLLRRLKVVICLGGIAFNSYLRARRLLQQPVPRPVPRFGHGLQIKLGEITLVASYHPSQQNTLTGRLTQSMFDEVFAMAGEVLGRNR